MIEALSLFLFFRFFCWVSPSNPSLSLVLHGKCSLKIGNLSWECKTDSSSRSPDISISGRQVALNQSSRKSHSKSTSFNPFKMSTQIPFLKDDIWISCIKNIPSSSIQCLAYLRILYHIDGRISSPSKPFLLRKKIYSIIKS